MGPGDWSSLKTAWKLSRLRQEIFPEQLVELPVQCKVRFTMCQQNDDVITTASLYYTNEQNDMRRQTNVWRYTSTHSSPRSTWRLVVSSTFRTWQIKNCMNKQNIAVPWQEFWVVLVSNLAQEHYLIWAVSPAFPSLCTQKVLSYLTAALRYTNTNHLDTSSNYHIVLTGSTAICCRYYSTHTSNIFCDSGPVIGPAVTSITEHKLPTFSVTQAR